MLFFLLLVSVKGADLNDNVLKYIENFNDQADGILRQMQLADWAYNTNLTDENKQAYLDQAEIWSAFVQDTLLNGSDFYQNTSQYSAETKRELELLRLMGGEPLNDDKRAELHELVARMEEIYSTATVDNVTLEYLEDILATNRSYDVLLAIWKGWRDAVGRPLRALYTTFVDLSNMGAQDYSFADTGELWRAGYDMSDKEVIATVERLWEELSPLYVQLHCYVRSKLSNFYGESLVPNTGFMKAHILGNMWAQEWSYIYDLIKPFKDSSTSDLTEQLIQQNYTVERMHQLGEDFYMSLGFDPLPDSFWNDSMLVEPEPPWKAVCHASAWDVGVDDLRIKMCTHIRDEDLYTLIHEQGHLYYFHSYRNLEMLYRDGANDGFHEAVGDTIRLSVTPDYLKRKGLLTKVDNSENHLINYQLKVALSKVAFLPYAYLLDQWRWKVFNGEIKPEDYNKAYWELREKYQGITSPIERENTLDFDPGAKYHVAANVPYLRYFLATVYQFQFHQSLCKAAGQPFVANCSIYNSKEAGAHLKSMLEMGRKNRWQDALKAISNTTEISAQPLIDYFSPLMKWLTKQNDQAAERCSWPGGPAQPAELSHRRNTLLLVLGVFIIFAVLPAVVIISWLCNIGRTPGYVQQLSEIEMDFASSRGPIEPDIAGIPSADPPEFESDHDDLDAGDDDELDQIELQEKQHLRPEQTRMTSPHSSRNNHQDKHENHHDDDTPGGTNIVVMRVQQPADISDDDD